MSGWKRSFQEENQEDNQEDIQEDNQEDNQDDIQEENQHLQRKSLPIMSGDAVLQRKARYYQRRILLLNQAAAPADLLQPHQPMRSRQSSAQSW